MEVDKFIAELDAEIERLQQVRALLSGLSQSNKRPGRPAQTKTRAAKPAKRQLSPEARARIAAAQKKRWAKAKAAK